MGLAAAVKILFQEARKWTWHHLVAFLITYFLYALYHACRKAFSNIKDIMGKSLSPMNSTMYPYDIWQKEQMFESAKDANEFFGELDFLFLLAYGIGLFVSGIIGDRVNLRYMLTFGIVGSSILTSSFGYLSVPFHVQNKMYFRCIFFLNGIFQSTGWPALVSVMGNWFTKSSSGLVFGVWSTNTNIGNVMGSVIVASVIKFGYEYGMLLNGILSFCGGIIVFFCLIPHPDDIGLKITDQRNACTNTEDERIESVDLSSSTIQPLGETSTLQSESNIETIKFDPKKSSSIVNDVKAITFYQACLIPGVLPYALSYACLKMVTYAFFFWLPTYLSQGLHWDDTISDNLSNFYDVGGILGSIASGVISDFMGFRSPVVSCMLFLSIISVYLYETLGGTYSINVILMIFSGCLLGGPASLICTAISADLGKNDKIAGNTQALSTVSGIIDGTGSLGAAIGQYLVGVISKYCGWLWVFKFLLIMISMSFALVLPMLVNDIKTWRYRRSSVNSI